MNRLELSRYIKIVTGHNNLFYHRHNIDPENNSGCRFCLTDTETFIHFVTDCSALWRERRDHLLTYVGHRDQEWTPTQLLNFSFSPQVTQALEMDHGDRERRGENRRTGRANRRGAGVEDDSSDLSEDYWENGMADDPDDL